MFVYQRLNIIECFIKPYNPFILVASNSRVHIELSRNASVFENFATNNQSQVYDNETNITHRKVAIHEAIALLDKTKRMSASSSPIEFIDASKSRKLYFKKTYLKQADTFEVAETGELYDVLPSFISRHFSRLNGDNILLAETVIHYDYVGKEESTRLFQLYQDNLQNIPDSKVESVYSKGPENTMLPCLILCKNGDVLKMRKTPKILVTPHYKTSQNIEYSRTMLYFPLDKEEDITNDSLSEMFHRKNFLGDDTIVRENERHVLTIIS